MKSAHNLVGLVACIATAATATSAEPPSAPALTCTVTQQEVSGAVHLRVRFENSSGVSIDLPPGPHLILYSDSEATKRFDVAARMDRIQRTPILVPPGASTEALYVVGEAMIASLGCSGARPGAAAMYFYRSSQQPQFRCLLRNFDFQAASSKFACPTSNAQGQRERQ